MAGRHIEIAGGVGGLSNGLVGAWGPVVTPWLLHRGLSPRVAVGSTNTAEVAVAIVAAGVLIGSVGDRPFEFGVALAMIAGGIVAAPLGAYVIRFIPARVLGLAVGGLLMLTQVRELGRLMDLPLAGWISSVVILIVVVLAGARPHVRERVPEAEAEAMSYAADGSARQPGVGVVDE